MEVNFQDQAFDGVVQLFEAPGPETSLNPPCFESFAPEKSYAMSLLDTS